MTPNEARDAILAGERVRMTVGKAPGDPVLIVWEEEGAIQSNSVGGWSEGVLEPVCARDSDFLLTYLSGRRELVLA